MASAAYGHNGWTRRQSGPAAVLFTRHLNNTTDIDADVVREGKNFKGRLPGVGLKPSAGTFLKGR